MESWWNTDTTFDNWAQAVESFELNYDTMHMYSWKFDLFFKICNLCFQFI